VRIGLKWEGGKSRSKSLRLNNRVAQPVGGEVARDSEIRMKETRERERDRRERDIKTRKKRRRLAAERVSVWQSALPCACLVLATRLVSQREAFLEKKKRGAAPHHTLKCAVAVK